MSKIDRRAFLMGSALLAMPAVVFAADDPYAASPWRKLTDAQWKKRLDLATYNVLRCEATEMAGTSPLNKEKRRGTYVCAGCALPHKNPARNHMHTLERQADQLKYAGIWPDAPTEPGTAPGPDLSWVLPKPSQVRPVPGGVRPKPYALFIPGGSAHRLDKRWPAERYGQLGKMLSERGYDIVIIGGLQESALARQIQRYVGQARDLTGRTDFAKVAMLGAKASLVVGNDTGPLHLAAATGAPTVVMFSSASDPELAAPRGHVTVLKADNLAELPVSAVLQAASALLPAA